MGQRRKFSAEHKREAVALLNAPGVTMNYIATKSGYASHTKSLIALANEISEAKVASDKFMNANRKVESTGINTVVTASYMVYAYGAMSQMIQTEIDRSVPAQ